jgi:hypothetical protein
MSTKYDSPRGIYKWSFAGQLTLCDHWQLRTHSL